MLCEKAFTVNADQTRNAFAWQKEKNLLITEAIWTRYMPSRKMIDDIISSGVIGEVTAVTANLNYAISEVERIRKPELAAVRFWMLVFIPLISQAWFLGIS